MNWTLLVLINAILLPVLVGNLMASDSLAEAAGPAGFMFVLLALDFRTVAIWWSTKQKNKSEAVDDDV